MQDELGARIVRLDPPMEAAELWTAWMRLRAFLNANGRRALWDDPATRAQLKPEMVWEIEQGRDLTTGQLHEASVIRTRWHTRLAQLFTNAPVIVVVTQGDGG